MARIALRAYNREIERLIEGGQTEEAIAHCRHIFKYFPKHINTYRLLGKAYLETQRYGDAADILQRVLSSVPDDFISHLGMSIIREDEGNLDEAIWHMERAFEVQPANRAIQDELRRLYGRRDGLEPPKIRLTRGALARMYAKGDLYPQAIAELRTALADDPQRLDLQVLLADVYAKSGQRVEAASVCNGLLRKLPYCLIANQVMADILADSERSDEARVYRQRAQALDAYLAHTSPGAPTSDKVQDIAVSLERLDWRPGKSIEGQGQPDWAASLGVELENVSSQKEEIPDWLSAVQAGSDQTAGLADDDADAEFTDKTETGSEWFLDNEETDIIEPVDALTTGGAQLSTEDEIPEWMKAAGWNPASGEAQEGPVVFDYDEEELETVQPEGEIEEAQLPDWLKEIAPENLEQAAPDTSNEEDWEQSSPEDAAILQGTPDWLQGMASEADEDEEPADWLAGLAVEAESGTTEETAGGLVEEIPDWLKETEADEEEAEEDQIPDWLQEPGSEEQPATIMEDMALTEAVESDELPDWLQEESGAVTSEQSVKDATVQAAKDEGIPTDEVPDWLKELESDETDTGTPEPKDEAEQEGDDEFPDWLKAAAVGEAVVKTAEAIPEWIKEADAEAETDIPPEAQKEEEISTEEQPDWLNEIQAESAISSTGDEVAREIIEAEAFEAILDGEEEVLADESMTVISVPDEVPDSTEPQEELELPVEESELESPPVSSAIEQAESPQSEELDDEAAFAWLESLAAKQGADEEDLLLNPDERIETPPAWVQDAVEAGTEEIEAAPDSSFEAEVEFEAALAESEPEVGPETELTSEEAETFPDWLDEAGVTFEIESAEIEEAAQPAEELPDWLQTMQPEEEPEQIDIQEAEEIPDWLLETQEKLGPEQQAVQPEEDWLVNLEEPIIEGDTKPTRVVAEDAEQDFTSLAETPTVYAPPGEAEEDFQPADEAQEYSPDETTTESELAESELDADVGFAWLESLAAKQGVDEGMLLPPEERLETPPDWIQSALDKQFGEAEIQEASEEAIVEEELEKETTASIEGVEVEEISEEQPELPEWLSDMEAKPETEGEAEPVEASLETAAVDEVEEEIPELPSWLEDTEEKEPPSWSPPEPVTEKLDLNQASLVELERLPGIGFIMAQNIITYREQNGPFQTTSDLQQVPGFNPAMLQDMEDLVMVETIEEEPLNLEVKAETTPELAEARKVMLAGTLDQALDMYADLILRKQSLEEVINDLNQVLQRHGDDASVWQTLGDAQMRANHVHEALESYMRAEQLFR